MPSIITLPVTEDDEPTPTFQITSGGTPLDLTAATVTAIIKASPSVEDTALGVYTLASGSGLAVTDAAQGKVRLDIPAAITASPGWWYYKIRVSHTAKPMTAIEGWIPVGDA